MHWKKNEALITRGDQATIKIWMNLVISRGHSYKNNELWNELKHQMRRGKAHNAVKIMVDNIKWGNVSTVKSKTSI